jgi:peptidoglycan/xylan/chitin deacetylase (PgdA/CDA1 family)
MDHSLYPYSALPLRQAGEARLPPGLQAYAVLFLEHWDFESPPGSLRDPRFVGEFGSFHPDYRNWSQREYGLRVGIFRVIEALQQAGIRPVIAANAMAAQRLPALVQQFNDWGCEWLAHGIAATRMMHSEQSLYEQREHIRSSLATLTQATGQRPRGWLSQDWGSSPDTYHLLAEAGMAYTLDWVNDDQPYWMSPAPGRAADARLLSIPLSSEWDDVQCQWLRNIEPRAWAELSQAAFDRLAIESVGHQRAAVFGLGLHPWLCGMPSRIAMLRQLLMGLKQRSDVSWTSPGALLDQIQPSPT